MVMRCTRMLSATHITHVSQYAGSILAHSKLRTGAICRGTSEIDYSLAVVLVVVCEGEPAEESTSLKEPERCHNASS
jgi:hypothetical protein